MADVRAGYFELHFRGDPDLSLEGLRGVGPKTAERMRDREIEDAGELLLELPRAYRHVHRHLPANKVYGARAGYVELTGRVVEVGPPNRGARQPFQVDVEVEGRTFELVWFRLPFHAFPNQFQPGGWVTFEGEVDWEYGTPSLAHPTTDIRDERPSRRPPEREVEPVYRSMEGVADSRFRDAIRQAGERLLPRAVDVLPGDLLDARDLGTVQHALETLHVLREIPKPERFDRELERARNRLVYEEFFTLQKRLAEDYAGDRRASEAPECGEREAARTMVRELPFTLTDDQKAVCGRLADDLGSSVPMRRLLQGDVGSGKTVVALLMAAIAVENDVQVAFMAPTEILARQHLGRARELFEGFEIAVDLLVGSLPDSEKEAVVGRLSSGETDLVVGTHALFQEEVAFEALGFVVVDEQHKFGVDQRQRLLEKGTDPHLLAMTATPIPRSLAHSVFGDLDLAVIREKPPGRKPVRTFLRDRPSAGDVYEYVGGRIEETGEQAFFVYPLVEPSDETPNRRSAVAAAERLANGPLSHLRVAVLHGRMDDTDKNRTMEQFADGAIDVVCATTVVEVGVDVPNATMMVIENAEVFGLSQLHQLRGRVGRGRANSICVLLAGYGMTPEARERLESFTQTDDGFELAEKDLELRGPGEFLGERQSGHAEFRFGELIGDAELLRRAREDARRRVLGDAGS